MRVDLKIIIPYNLIKPRNLGVKELRTPKYRMRVVRSVFEYTRKVKHKCDHSEL